MAFEEEWEERREERAGGVFVRDEPVGEGRGEREGVLFGIVAVWIVLRCVVLDGLCVPIAIVCRKLRWI